MDEHATTADDENTNGLSLSYYRVLVRRVWGVLGKYHLRRVDGLVEDIAGDIFIQKIPWRIMDMKILEIYWSKYHDLRIVEGDNISSLLARGNWRGGSPPSSALLNEVWEAGAKIGGRRWKVIREWVEGRSMRDIAKELGVTRTYCYLLKKDILVQLRKVYHEENGTSREGAEGENVDGEDVSLVWNTECYRYNQDSPEEVER